MFFFIACILFYNDFAFARFTPEVKTRAIQAVKEGNSFSEVARQLDTSPQNVYNWVRIREKRTGLQIKPKRQKFTSEKKVKVIQAVKEGGSFTEVARQLNITPETASKWVRSEEKRTGLQIALKRKSFAPQEKERARQLAKERKNFTKVARQFNTSRQNVTNWVHKKKSTGKKNKSKRQKFTSEKKAQAIQAVKEGGSFSEVARQFNVKNPTTIFKWVRSEEKRTGLQIKPKSHKFTSEEKAQARKLVKEGRSSAETARQFNTSRQNVHNWVHNEKKRTGQQIVRTDQLFLEYEYTLLIAEISNNDPTNPNSLLLSLDRLKRQLEDDIDNELILSKEIKESISIQLEASQKNISLNETLAVIIKTKIYHLIANIKELVSSNTPACALELT